MEYALGFIVGLLFGSIYTFAQNYFKDKSLEKLIVKYENLCNDMYTIRTLNDSLNDTPLTNRESGQIY